jgi:hypothetical protein
MVIWYLRGWIDIRSFQILFEKFTDSISYL